MIKNLKTLRGKKDISQKQLAEEISVSQQSINKYENHDVEPDINILIRMADFFDVSVDYLIGNTDVDRKVERVEPYDLNAEEAALIEDYRSLRKSEKASIRSVIENFKAK